MTDISTLSVQRIPAFVDNYIWAIHFEDSVTIVDPGDATIVKNYLDQRPTLKLCSILITHHHHDHIGGVAELVSSYPHICLWLPLHSSLKQQFPRQAQTVDLASGILELRGMTMQVIATPGHTLDHIVYYLRLTHADSGHLFCGDTLFSGGCGRLLEGSPSQMLHSLDILADLPSDTWVYCAHEYTLANLRFAQVVDPHNQALLAYIKQCENALLDQGSTIPSRMDTEREINPFLRVDLPALRQSASDYANSPLNSRSEVFAALRAWKNIF